MRLNKIETSEWYNSELDKLHKEDKDVYVKLQLGKRITHGEYEREPKNGFQIINKVNKDTFPLTLDNYEVYEKEDVALSKEQLVVLDWLTDYLVRTRLTIADSIRNLIAGEASDSIFQYWADLTSKEEAEVIKKLADYVLDKGDSL